MPLRKTLAESANFRVTHEFEQAFLVDKRTGSERSLGSHYGDPKCAVIAPDESWFAVGGEGVTGFHGTRGEFTLLRDSCDVREVRVRYQPAAAGEWRVLEGIRTEKLPAVFVKALSINDRGQLVVVADDEENRAFVFDVA